MEREIIKDQLTKCHIDELMCEETVCDKRTEIQDNYIKLSVRPVKPTRRSLYEKKMYEEMTRKVLIEHELKLKEQSRCDEGISSEYMEGYAHSAWIPIDITKHQIYPLYKKDDAITFWTHKTPCASKSTTKPPTIRKITRFSKPIGEQLDTQFH